MKVGDIVRLIRLSSKGQLGIVIDNPRRLHREGRFDILMEDGTMVKDLPRPYIEVINESI